MRMLDQPSPHPHPLKRCADCFFCDTPSDSEDDQVHRRVARKNTRKGARLDKLTKHFNFEHPIVPLVDGGTFFQSRGFSSGAAGPEIVVEAPPRSHDSELETLESAEHGTMSARPNQYPQRSAPSSDLPNVIAKFGSVIGQPYWRALTLQIDAVLKTN